MWAGRFGVPLFHLANAMADLPTGAGLSMLRVRASSAAYMGPGRADLLELIGTAGSIREAATQLGMSYKRAWSLVQALNEGFGAPLVETNRGGTSQGARLTPRGEAVLALYRDMHAKAEAAIADDIHRLAALIERDGTA